MNCGSYYVCLGGKWNRLNCAEGTYFNQTHGKCVNNTDGLCQSNSKLQQPCNNGTVMKMNMSSCSAYYLCINESWVVKNCPSGHYFNETLRVCMQDNKRQCSDYIEQEYVESGRKFNPTDCTAFQILQNNAWLSVRCPAGFYFDISLSKCLVNSGECSSNGLIRHNCTDRSLKPSFSNFSEFFQHLQKCVVSNTSSSELMPVSQCSNVIPRSEFYFSDEIDCTKFHFCENGIRIDGVCGKEKFFNSKSQRCEHDKNMCGSKRMTHDSICQSVSNGTIQKNPFDCSTFYKCVDMSALLSSCPQGEYFDSDAGVCQNDIQKCHCDETNVRQYPHETYCSLYYTCISGKIMAIACEDDFMFDTVSNKCISDIDSLCIDGLLKTSNFTDETITNTSITPNSNSCIGRHGDIIPDPHNCNKFYVCINEQLRHEICFDGDFFNATKNSCSHKTSNDICQNITEVTINCSTSDPKVNYVDHSDCRKYYQCNEDGELTSKKCRNGESFDNLLGFCKQNDGTCLIENGQRVGACAGKHGVVVADADNCHQYYTCVNGQKILKICKLGEYFDRSKSKCQEDIDKTCTVLEDNKFAHKTLLET
ncbi:peritrophin-48-like [Eupeodes corollae]|uniref:peritrophin-48-like n=1 Tax=Eupeodes corollae TaxID=290404 RepID=UPI0024925FF2|nr:peritrophin-48-like [Eupeodes corollae]